MHDQLNPNEPIGNGQLSPPEFHVHSSISVFLSAIAHYFAPSDDSEVSGMCREHIRATLCWQNGPPRYDCILAQKDVTLRGMKDLHATCVRLFMSFYFEGARYPCALIQWYSNVSNAPDEDTRIWVVEPDFNDDGSCFSTVIYIDSIMRGAHLISVYGSDFISPEVIFSNSLDAF